MKPRLLIPITIQFSVRYLLRTGLLSKICLISNPVILLGWQDLTLQKELEKMGCEVYPLPKVKMSTKFARLRKKIHVIHFNHISSASTTIDQRRNDLFLTTAQRTKKALRSTLYKIEGSLPSRFQNLCELEKETIHRETNFGIFEDLVERIQPDALFSITPYFLEEEFIARAVANTNAKLSTAILSFDNLTTRPRIPIFFDQYLLWNNYNKQELIRIYPQTKNKKITIVGSPQFDFYYDPTYLWSKNDWQQRLGIPENRKVILFAAGPFEIAPPEPHWVAQLDKAIQNGEILGNPIILLRRHPVDTPDRWTSIRETTKNVIFDDPWAINKEVIGRTNVTRYDIEKLVSILAYSDVHINTSSTMTIDGAIFDKPQIGPAYDDQSNHKYHQAMIELYEREHYLPITQSGGLEIVHSRDQLIQTVNKAINDPTRLSCERKKMVREICSFDDGKSTDRVFAALHAFLTS